MILFCVIVLALAALGAVESKAPWTAGVIAVCIVALVALHLWANRLIP